MPESANTDASESEAAAAAAPARKVFLGFNAYVAKVTGVYRTAPPLAVLTPTCDVVAQLSAVDEIDFSHGATLPINMMHNASLYDPGATKSIRFTSIYTDDFGVATTGGKLDHLSNPADGPFVTSIGPRWPHGGRFGGGLYLERDQFVTYRKQIEHARPWPPAGSGFRDCQFVSILYSDSLDNRFLGFAGILKDVTDTKLTFNFLRPDENNWSREIELDKTDIDFSVGRDILRTSGNVTPTKDLPLLEPTLDDATKPGPAVIGVFVRLRAAAQHWKTDAHGGLPMMSPKMPFYLG